MLQLHKNYVIHFTNVFVEKYFVLMVELLNELNIRLIRGL